MGYYLSSTGNDSMSFKGLFMSYYIILQSICEDRVPFELWERSVLR